MARGLGARALLDLLADPASIATLDRPITQGGQEPGYRAELLEAARVSGCDEAVITARIRIDGRELVALVSEFAFLGGSLGAEAARRLVEALQHATLHRLPVLALPASGGTRMQEGTAAFLRMIDVADAVLRHRSAGLPYLVHLRHPTTGGAFASWGSLGQITTATPSALIGLLGPRVTEALNGTPFPREVQTAENLNRQGIIDELVPEERLRDHLTTVLGHLEAGRPRRTDLSRPVADSAASSAHITRPDAWTDVLNTRSPERPGLRDLLAATGSPVYLRGTGAGERDDAIAVALSRIAGHACVVVGHDRHAAGAPGPGALRGARRGMSLAEELGLPLITVVDTAGAQLSADAENGALAGEVARTLGELRTLTVPTTTVLLGQGCGAAALALFSGRHTIAAPDAWLAPLPLEGASMIVHRDTGHAAELAAEQGITAVDLARSGRVDRLLPPVEHIGDLIPAALTELERFLAGHSALAA
ncbi:carboxyl transferase domain-containing protein [Arthrobacter woluwensis]|uniref:carboxyl transferase domain-containing protein n=1 Tax=Arthrobacter woluwensis TaxID=156980 RepID=UPI00381438F6